MLSLQSELALRILAGEHGGATDPVAAWAATATARLAAFEALARELRAAANPDLALLVVAIRHLRRALD